MHLRYIHATNRKKYGFKLSVNHLVDLSNEELKSMCGYKKSNNDFNGGKAFPYNKNDFTNLPADFDWRIQGAVTPVKGNIFLFNFCKWLEKKNKKSYMFLRSINLWFLLEFWYHWNC